MPANENQMLGGLYALGKLAMSASNENSRFVVAPTQGGHGVWDMKESGFVSVFPTTKQANNYSQWLNATGVDMGFGK